MQTGKKIALSIWEKEYYINNAIIFHPVVSTFMFNIIIAGQVKPSDLYYHTFPLQVYSSRK